MKTHHHRNRKSITSFLLSKTVLFITLFIFVFNFLYVYSVFSSHYFLPGNDPAQWLIRARFFLGKSIPSYQRQYLFKVPPICPLVLALFIAITGNALIGMKLLATLAYTGIIITMYLLAQKVLDDRVIALLIASFTAFSQTLVLKLAAFGGLPNLLAFLFMNLAFTKVSDCLETDNRPRDWILLSFFSGLVFFTHTATGIVYFLSLGLLFFHFLFSKEDKKQFLLNAAKFIVPILTIWILYLTVFLQNSYSNLANYYRRGFTSLVWLLYIKTPMYEQIVMVGGTVLLPVTILYFLLHREKDPHRKVVIPTLWAISIFLLVGILLGLKAKISYVRMAYYFSLPLIFSFGYGVSKTIDISKTTDTSSNLYTRISPKQIYGILLICGFLTVSGFYSLKQFSAFVDFYTPNQEAEMRDILTWVKHNTKANGTILVRWKLLGLWIEGLTGRTTLHSRGPFAFLPGQVARSRTAETLYNSRFAIENGLVTVRSSAVKSYIPYDPHILTYYKGGYESTLRLTQYKSLLTFQNKSTPYNMEDLFEVRNFTLLQSQDTAKIIGQYWPDYGNKSVMLTKTITVPNASSTVSIDYHFNTSYQFNNITMAFRARDVKQIQTMPNRFRYWQQAFDGNRRLTTIHWNNTFTSTRNTRNPNNLAMMYIDANVNRSQVSFQLQIQTTPYPRISAPLTTYDTATLLQQYNIRYFILEQEGHWMKESLYRKFGFPIVYHNQGYQVFKIHPNKMWYRDFPFKEPS